MLNLAVMISEMWVCRIIQLTRILLALYVYG